MFRGYLVVLVAPVAGILLALAAGASPQRLRAAVAFQGLALVAALYFMVALRMRVQTAKRQRLLGSLLGIRFKTPIWMVLMECSIPIEIGAALAAVAALLGFAGVGDGVFLTFALIALGMPWFKVGVQPRSITLEQNGVQISMARTTFLVPWTSIAHVESVGPDHFVGLNIILRSSESILESVQPPTSKARDQTKNLVQSSPGGDARMFVIPWAAGLDGQTLERGIREGMRGTTPGIN